MISNPIPTNSIIISDTFDISLDSWIIDIRPNDSANSTYCSTLFTPYNLIHSSVHTGSTNLNYDNVCWFGAAGGIKSFDFPTGYNTLEISLDYRSLANIFAGIGHVNNIHILISDSNNSVLYADAIYSGLRSSDISDTDWQEYIASIPVSSTDCPCTVYIYLNDSWRSTWQQQNYFDTVILGATNTASQRDSIGYTLLDNSLRSEDYLNMQSSNSTLVNSVNLYSDTIEFSWDADKYDYKVVIAPSDSPRDKTGHIVSGDTFVFTSLEPDTRYDIRVGIRGDDSTQSILQYTTLPTSTLNFDSNIILNAAYNSDTVHLMWLDLNDFGDNRYRVEISIDGVSFEETSLRPGANSLIEFTINDDDDYAGDTIYYRIFEWYGNQKIYSNHVSVVLSN